MIPLIQLENISKSFGDRCLYEGISFAIGEGNRISLIAPNGAGKTTLLRIISGAESADTGKVTFKNDIRVGFLTQEPDIDPSLTLLEALFASDSPTARVVRDYESALLANDTLRLTELSEQMDALNAWSFESEAKTVLTKLKIDALDCTVGSLSGGQLKRLSLAILLIDNPEVLILDEPTNHLDIRSKDVLKQALMDFNGTLIVVSHDREFLDGLVNKVYEFRNGVVKQHLGGIYDFLRSRNMEVLDELNLKAQAESIKSDTVSSSKLSYVEQKEREKVLRRLRNDIKKAEELISALEAEIKTMDEQLADPEAHGIDITSGEYFEKYNTKKSELHAAEEKWTELSMELEEQE